MTDNLIIPAADAAALAGWQSPATTADDAGALAIVQREDTELKAAIVSAKHFPRDESGAYVRIVKMCQRPGFAEGAAYSFPRGGAQVTGPSIRLARGLAQCWGNIRTGLRIVQVDADQVHIRGYALDLETNTYVEAEDRFAKLIQRKDRKTGRTSWVEPDERDLRELINRRGAICVRNAILQLLPADVTEDALKTAGDTMRKAAAGDLQQDRVSAVRRLVLAFEQLAVTPAMLEAHLGHPLDAIDDAELADLRSVFVSIRDGNTRRQDHFDVGTPREAGATSVLNERLEAAEPEPVKAEPEPVAGPATLEPEPLPEPLPEPTEEALKTAKRARQAPLS